MNLRMKNYFLLKQFLILFLTFSTVILPLHLYREARFRSIPIDSYTGTHQWLTGSTVKFCNIWFQNSAKKLNFVMYEEPFLIENGYRPNAYISYPPGTLLPIFCAAKVMGKKELRPADVKKFIMLIYYAMIALFAMLSMAVFHYQGVKTLSGTICSIVIAAIFAYLSPNYYYLCHVFFSDQMVLLYVLAFIILECADLTERFSRRVQLIRFLQMLTVFCGCFTDYYFCMLIAVAVLVRMFSCPVKPFAIYLQSLVKSCWQYIIGCCVAFAIFAVQLYKIPDALLSLKGRFISRSFCMQEGISNVSLAYLWEKIHFLHPFSFFILIGIAALTVLWLIPSFRKKMSSDMIGMMKVLVILFWGSLIHSTVFFQHTLVHEFSVLKYCIVFTYTALVLLCFCFKCFNNGKRDTSEYKLLAVGVAAAIFALPFTLPSMAYEHYRIRNYEIVNMDVAKFVSSVSPKNDVVFSFTWCILQNPPFEISVSKKRVYQIRGLKEFPMEMISPDMTVAFVLSPSELGRSDIQKILSFADERIDHPGMIYLRFRPSVLMQHSPECRNNYFVAKKDPLPLNAPDNIAFRLNKNIFSTVLYRRNYPCPPKFHNFFLHVYKKGSSQPLFVENFTLDPTQLRNFTGKNYNTVVIPPEFYSKDNFIKIGQFIPFQKRLWERDIPFDTVEGLEKLPPIKLETPTY